MNGNILNLRVFSIFFKTGSIIYSKYCIQSILNAKVFMRPALIKEREEGRKPGK